VSVLARGWGGAICNLRSGTLAVGGATHINASGADLTTCAALVRVLASPPAGGSNTTPRYRRPLRPSLTRPPPPATPHKAVAVDEAQFFPDLLEFALEQAEGAGRHVLVAGLALDFRRRRWGLCRPEARAMPLVPVSCGPCCVAAHPRNRLSLCPTRRTHPAGVPPIAPAAPVLATSCTWCPTRRASSGSRPTAFTAAGGTGAACKSARPRCAGAAGAHLPPGPTPNGRPPTHPKPDRFVCFITPQTHTKLQNQPGCLHGADCGRRRRRADAGGGLGLLPPRLHPLLQGVHGGADRVATRRDGAAAAHRGGHRPSPPRCRLWCLAGPRLPHSWRCHTQKQPRKGAPSPAWAAEKAAAQRPV
jgi:hypothetical protein